MKLSKGNSLYFKYFMLLYLLSLSFWSSPCWSVRVLFSVPDTMVPFVDMPTSLMALSLFVLSAWVSSALGPITFDALLLVFAAVLAVMCL